MTVEGVAVVPGTVQDAGLKTSWSGLLAISNVEFASRWRTPRKNWIIVFMVLGIYVFAAEASAERLTLLCEGTLPTYEDGFGKTKIDYNSKTTRLIEIDLSGKRAKMHTLFGERSVPLSKYSDEQFITFSIPHNVIFRGISVIEEQVSINRYSGEIMSLYTTEPKSSEGAGYVAFIGSCKKADKKF